MVRGDSRLGIKLTRREFGQVMTAGLGASVLDAQNALADTLASRLSRGQAVTLTKKNFPAWKPGPRGSGASV